MGQLISGPQSTSWVGCGWGWILGRILHMCHIDADLGFGSQLGLWPEHLHMASLCGVWFSYNMAPIS
jgi:hypothetical protein